MELDDQAFLSQIEENIRSKDSDQSDGRRDAEQRALEMERIRQATAGQVLPGQKPAAVGTAKPNDLENDPRYREYFARLKRQKGVATPSGGSQSISSSTPQAQATPRAGSPEPQVVGPGSIVRFDDGSIGVYKDAVSGRDYALFYFLQPDGQFVPEGVFLQCYQAKAIGTLPENYFAALRDESTWNRDVIVYHLSSFEFVSFLDGLAEHVERRPNNSTPARNNLQMAQSARATPAMPQPSESQPAAGQGGSPAQQPVGSPEPVAEITPQYGPRETVPTPTPPRGTGGMVRGQQFTINFGGKKWQAVFWSSDSNGSIVAHSTHGSWSLMRLDLDRFKDSLQIGNVVDSETFNAITEDAAKTGA